MDFFFNELSCFQIIILFIPSFYMYMSFWFGEKKLKY